MRRLKGRRSGHTLVRQGGSFAEVQREVRYHYQWMVLHDFLPQIDSLVTILTWGNHFSLIPPLQLAQADAATSRALRDRDPRDAQRPVCIPRRVLRPRTVNGDSV